MIIGLKYCGGCNPTYDRGAAVGSLKNYFKDKEVTFASYDPSGSYEYCLLVEGCNRECLPVKTFSNCGHLFVAVSQEDFNKIKDELCTILENECAE